jgi:hypothetical protein
MLTLDDLTPHERQLRAEALALVPGDPPTSWSAGVHLHAGGVIASGWDIAERVLLVSHDGYSLSDPRTSERLLRDRDPAAGYACLSETRLTFTLPTTGEIVPVFGIFGGGGICVRGAWQLAIIAPTWPREMVVLWDPSASGMGAGRRSYFHGAHHLRVPLGGTLLGCGFAPSGRHFMVAASDGAVVFSREE